MDRGWIIDSAKYGAGDCFSDLWERDSAAVKISLGKYTGRVQRIFLHGSNQPLDSQWLQQEHPYLQLSPIDPVALKLLLQNSSAYWDMQDARYFVVMPDHQAVLYFTAEDDANGLLDDLKHLLKYSPDR